MKKGLIFLLVIMSFLGVNTVSAKEIYFEYDTRVDLVKSSIDSIGYDIINDKIYELINYYNSNLSNDYPYYFIRLDASTTSDTFIILLQAFSKLSYNFHNSFLTYSDGFIYKVPIDGNTYSVSVSYTDSAFSDYNILTGSYSPVGILSVISDEFLYNPYHYYYSNFDLLYKGTLFSDNSYLPILNTDDTLLLPSLNDPSSYSVHNANSDFLLEPYFLYDDNVAIKDFKYTSINLNEYSYVALSLKDYNSFPLNNYSVFTNIYVKGQLCITPVYNYGLTERKDILSGTQIQGCSQYYNDFSLTRMYILKEDVENHAIYYLKAYDTSKDNYVKIDTSKFNISYITSENENNPEVLINGKLYPTLPYSSLTDTSTKSEDEGYVPGVSCAVGDFNCYNENNTDNIFDSVFSSPLDFLKDIWGSVTSIFDIITEFISLLPDTMQSFLYLSFMVAIILGLLKLIL